MEVELKNKVLSKETVSFTTTDVIMADESKEIRYIKRTFPSLRKDGKWYTLGYHKEVAESFYEKYILPTKELVKSDLTVSDEYLLTEEEESYTDLIKYEGIDTLSILIGVEQAKVNKMKEILKLKQEEILAIITSIANEAKV